MSLNNCTCVECLEQINQGAKVCHHCGCGQRWYYSLRRPDVISAILAILSMFVALKQARSASAEATRATQALAAVLAVKGDLLRLYNITAWDSKILTDPKGAGVQEDGLHLAVEAKFSELEEFVTCETILAARGYYDDRPPCAIRSIAAGLESRLVLERYRSVLACLSDSIKDNSLPSQADLQLLYRIAAHDERMMPRLAAYRALVTLFHRHRSNGDLSVPSYQDEAGRKVLLRKIAAAFDLEES